VTCAKESSVAQAQLRKEDLHASVSDPVLDTMNFLNEITQRYPGPISFALGRPYDGFFDTEQIFTHIRGYLDYLPATGNSAAEVRDALFQYGPTAGRIRDLIASSLRADENIDVPPDINRRYRRMPGGHVPGPAGPDLRPAGCPAGVQSVLRGHHGRGPPCPCRSAANCWTWRLVTTS
jgi:hypothetical protein